MSDRYDAGLLNDFGGGNVDWWQDYIRAEVERANDFHALLHEHSDAVISDRDARISDLEAQNEWLRAALEFVRAWAWRDDPPSAARNLSDRERLLAIKYHPVINCHPESELNKAAQEMHKLRKQLEQHMSDAKKGEEELRSKIRERANILASAEQGLDLEKIALAKTVIYARGAYERAGEARASVIHDAIKQLATGEPVRQVYGDLWQRYFGTKNYDRWSGQRSDNPYFMGPGHGSICFEVGIVGTVRDKRKQSDLTADEVEAAIYYLTNIQRVQEAERKAAIQSAA